MAGSTWSVGAVGPKPASQRSGVGLMLRLAWAEVSVWQSADPARGEVGEAALPGGRRGEVDAGVVQVETLSGADRGGRHDLPFCVLRSVQVCACSEEAGGAEGCCSAPLPGDSSSVSTRRP